MSSSHFEIPSDLPNYACIEYPGKVINVENALKTLGGSQSIHQTLGKHCEYHTNNEQKQHAQQEPYLELHLNEGGVFDHPLFGKISNVKNCLLIKKTTRVRKKRKRKLNEISSPSSKTMDIQVMGRVTKLVTFDGLADFQLFTDFKQNDAHPKQPSAASTSSPSALPKTAATLYKKRRLWSLREDEIANASLYPLVPAVLSGRAQPNHGFIAEQSSTKKTHKNHGLQSLATAPLEIQWSDPRVPQKPQKESIWRHYWDAAHAYETALHQHEEQRSAYSFCERIRNQISLQIFAYFEQKPIWQRRQLMVQSFYVCGDDISNFKDTQTSAGYDGDIAMMVHQRIQRQRQTHVEHAQKTYLEHAEKERLIGKFLWVAGYKFSHGPFRHCHIRFGFDPRDKRNKNIARPLQTLEYRVGADKGRRLCIQSQFKTAGNRVGKRGKPTTSSTSASSSSASTSSKQRIALVTEDDNDQQLEREIDDRLHFRAKPNRLHTHYQLANVDIALVQRIIHDSCASSYNAECDKSNGWITGADLARIRECMDDKTETWLEQMPAAASATSSPPRQQQEQKQETETSIDDAYIVNTLERLGDEPPQNDDDEDVFDLL